MALRAAHCQRVADQRGARHTTRLIRALADYGAISDALPFPCQKQLAEDCGVTERTIRNWLAILERLGLVEVYRSHPRRQADGTYTRRTNRYVLCDRKAQHSAPASPVRRRHRSTSPFSPRGNQLPQDPSRFEPGRAATPLAAPEPPPGELDAREALEIHTTEDENAPVAPRDVVAGVLAAARGALGR